MVPSVCTIVQNILVEVLVGKTPMSHSTVIPFVAIFFNVAEIHLNSHKLCSFKTTYHMTACDWWPIGSE